jgi:DNA invertase Pin-like site-specific DNA recombinase
MRYLIYLRVSTKDQDNRSQENACMNYIKAKHGNEPVEYIIFTDNKTSKKGVYVREGSRQLLRVMKPGDTIICIRIDRLSRIPKDSTKLLSDLEEKKINIVAIDQPGISNYVIAGVYIGMAAEEVKTLRKRIVEKFEAKRARGEVLGQLPYGFSLDMNRLISIKVGNEWVKKPAYLMPNLQEQENIQAMLDLQSQGLSYRNIAKKLIELGRTNRGGKAFGFANIHRILSRIEKDKARDQLHPEQEPHCALVSR